MGRYMYSFDLLAYIRDVTFNTFFFFSPSSGQLQMQKNSAPNKMVVDGGTTAATQPTPMADTTGEGPTAGTWQNMGQMMVLYG